jgi:hypothetical protein
MEIFVDPEFQKLIPPLSAEEQGYFNSNSLAFQSFYEYAESRNHIEFIPTPLSCYWQFANRSTRTGEEEYTKNPTALSRILSFTSVKAFASTGKLLNPFFHLPVEPNYYERKQDKGNKLKTNVYIIQSEVGGPIKIGKADDVYSRVAQHQVGSPFILTIKKIYRDVDPGLEFILHNQFKEYRLHGEWFSGQVLDMLEEHYE